MESVDYSVDGEERKGERPAFRVVKPEKDGEGNKRLVEVGAMWRKTSKAGNEFYSMKMGAETLLVFPNKKV